MTRSPDHPITRSCLSPPSPRRAWQPTCTKLVEGHKLILAGLKIPSPTGTIPTATGTWLHSLVDALLERIGGGDIGELFPDTTRPGKMPDSRQFVQVALERCQSRLDRGNVDVLFTAKRRVCLPIKPNACPAGRIAFDPGPSNAILRPKRGKTGCRRRGGPSAARWVVGLIQRMPE